MRLPRRHFLGALSAVSLAGFDVLAEPERGKARIADIRAMMLQGPRTYTLVKVIADAGLYGIGEGYGSPDVGVKQAVLELRPQFIGKDPLEIETLFNSLGNLTSGSQLRAAGAIETALWDLAGKLLNQPVAALLGGHYRERIRAVRDEGPPNMLDRSATNEWADKMRSDPAGWTAFQVEPPRAVPRSDVAADRSNLALTSHDLREIRQGFEYLRDAIGWDADLVVQCRGEFDLRSAIQLAEAVEPVKPLWIAGALPSGFSESWTRLAAASKVPIAAGPIPGARAELKDFILHQGCDVVLLGIRDSGGLSESKKIADLAELFSLPVAAHNTGSVVSTMATVQWASAVRRFLAAEILVGRRNWMDDVIVHDGPLVDHGYLHVPQKPGLGIELNPDVVKANLAAGENYWE